MVIYSQRVAALLMLKGFVLQGMEKNKLNNRKNIFYFKDSDELKLVLSDISKIK
jgi:hypothetical protein